MKKFLLVLIALLSLQKVQAYNAYIDGIYYNFSGSSATVTYRNTSYNSYSGKITIPEKVTYNGSTYSVTSIGYEAFKYCSGLTSITIPNSVTSIDTYAFYDCSGLTSIEIPNSVTSIGGSFNGCNSLKEVTFVDGETSVSLACNTYNNPGTGKGLFADCPLEKLYLGRNITYYTDQNHGYSPFYNQSKLSSVTIGNLVTSIGGSAFSGCSGLTNIEIPNSVTSIGGSAFSGCSGLTSITIPNSVTSVGNYVFKVCTSLKEVTFVDGESSVSLGYNEFTSVGKGLFSDCPLEKLYLGRNITYEAHLNYGFSPFYNQSKLTSVTIGDKVTEIPPCLFFGYDRLTNITIPNSVTSIGYEAFYGCSGLRSITIPNSVTSIGYEAFSGCSGLRSVEIPNSVISIGERAFEGCWGLKSVTIPNSVTSIGRSVFYGCSGLTSVTIPSLITSIGSGTFSGCSGLTSITIPNSVTSIDNYAFNGCTSLKEVTFVDGELSISLGYNDYDYSNKGGGKGLFADCPLEKLYLGRNLTYNAYQNYGYSPFYNQSKLTSVTISDKVSELPNYLFYSCSGLTSITIPNSVTSIGSSAFYGCSGLTSITIPNSVTSIGTDAFSGCCGLISVTIGNSVTSIGNYAFNGCTSLKEVTFVDGETSVSLGCNVYSSKYTGKGLFADCPLEKLYLGRNITYKSDKSYGYSPFYIYNQSNLTSVIIGDKVTNIPQYLFYGCSVLIRVTIPNSVTTIAENAFSGCSKIKEIFYNCLSLPKIVFEKDVYANANVIFAAPEITFDAIYNEDWSRFEHLYCMKDGKYYVPLVWDTLLSSSKAIYSWDKGCIIPLNEESIISSSENAMAYYKGENISEALVTTGYSLSPSNLWKQNKIYIEDYSEDVSRTVNVATAGTLFNELGMQDIQKIEALTITGEINGTDVMVLNQMTQLKYIDIKNCKIVEGGQTYRDNLKTENDVVGSYFLYNLSNLHALILSHSVTKINDNAFNGNSSLIYVGIGSSTQTIGVSAFKDCSNLGGMVIPACVTSIGNSCFANCNMLSKIIFEDGESGLSISSSWIPYKLNELYLGRNITSTRAFENQANLVKVEISDKVTVLSSYTFSGCSAIKEIRLPNSLNAIGNYCFSGCKSLNNIILSESLTILPQYCFNGCSTLSTIRIPSSIDEICNYAFSGCSGLKELVIKNATTTLSIGYNGSKGQFADCPLEKIYVGRNISYSSGTEYGYSPFANLTTLTEIAFSDNITSLNDYYLYGCSDLSQIVLTFNLTTIGSYCFNGCSKISMITIPASITSIENYAFSGCSALKELVIEDATATLSIGYNGSKGQFADSPLEKIFVGRNISYSSGSEYGYSPFANRTTLSEITFSDNIRLLNDYYLYGCNNLRNLALPNLVTDLGESALRGCASITELEIPETIKSFGAYCFYGCSSLKSINIPNNITVIPGHCFCGCSSLPAIDLHENISSIGDYAFANCKSFTTIIIPGKVTELAAGLFSGCSNLKTVIYSNKTTSIGDYCFNNCSKLSKITIPASITSIGNYAFSGCSGLKELVIEDSTTTLSIGYNGSKGQFIDSPLEKIYVGRNLSYSSGSSYGYSPFANRTTLTEITFGKNITKLNDYYLYGCSGISNITLVNSIRTIGLSAFEKCNSIESISIPKSVTTIGTSAFRDCSSLKEISVPDAVSQLQDYTFAGCTGMETLTLGKGLKNINSTAFQSCANIMKIRSLAAPKPPVITTEVFKSVDKDACLLVVTKGNLVYYWADPVWHEFLNMSDDMLALSPLPSAKYGDAAIDLAEYAPAGYTLTYDSSNPDVARIDGSTLTIVGAGEATIGASYDTTGTPMEIIGQLRQLIVDKADLEVGVASFSITEGDAVPELTLIVDGLCYDDTVEDIEEMPVAVCEVTSESAPGDYPVTYVGGRDNNYNFVTREAAVTVLPRRVVTLAELPAVTYGDEHLLLIEGDEEVALTYESSDKDVIEVEGSMLYIRGVGEATITARTKANVNLENAVREITVSKAPLRITVEDVEVPKGAELMPEFVYIVEGLCYDDTIDDIEELPTPVHSVTPDSPLGTYEVTFEGGHDRNYDINTQPANIFVIDTNLNVIPGIEAEGGTEVEIYQMNGVLIFRGKLKDANLSPGYYLIRTGEKVAKVYVK